MPLHSDLKLTELHSVVAFQYATAAARLAAVLTANDIGKVAIQTDDESIWVLVNNSPLTWDEITDTTIRREVVLKARRIIAGPGLSGTGDLSVDRTLQVGAPPDGSIVVEQDWVRVGVISDTQHGNRGNGSLHTPATQAADGFMSATDKTKLDGVSAQADKTVLATLAPPAVATSGAVGTATDVARRDHTHAHGTQAGGNLHADASGAASGFMSAADKAKLDTVEAGATASFVPPMTNTTPQNVAASSATGTSTEIARADHVHGHGAQAGGTAHSVATTSVNGFMAAADKSKLDGIDANADKTVLATTAPPSVGSASAIGGSTEVARKDHTHAHGSQVGGTTHDAATGSTAGFLSAADKTKLDTVATNATSLYLEGSTAPQPVGTAAAGVATKAAAADHVHAHGNQAGGALHAVVGASDGFMLAADKTKLDSVTPANIPSSNEKSALAGTTGTPGSANKFVTDTDGRLSNSRTPVTHATSHQQGGADQLALDPSQVTGLTASLAAKADDSGVVHKTGNETVAGVKTFSSLPTIPATPSASTDAASKGYVDAQMSALSGTYGPAMADITALRAVASASIADMQMRLVEAKGSIYRYDTSGTGTDDGDGTIKPTDAGTTGRWFKVQAATQDHEALANLLGGAASDHQHLTTTEKGQIPSATQKQALTGSQGAPALANPYVTHQDPRLSDSRAPTAHETSHLPNGSDPIATASPANIGTSNNTGSANSLSRSDHVHAHGAQTDGTLHAAVTTSVNGFMSAADKTKLDGVASSATNTPLGSATPASLGSAATGTSANASHEDHVHAHGSQTDPAAHALVGTNHGFMSSTDKTKLDGITPANIPTATEKAAFAGTNGSPSGSNKFVTDSDARLTNSRTPTAHAATHGNLGTDPITVTESQVTGLVSDLAAKAADSAVVHNTADESVAGIKTFSSLPKIPVTAPTLDAQVASKKYVDDQDTAQASTLNASIALKATDTAVVHNTGAEPVGGLKTFSTTPQVPVAAPTQNAEVANKKYVDDQDATRDTAIAAKATDILALHKAGVESITGVKTFAAGATPVITDQPVNATDAANKKYVDDQNTSQSSTLNAAIALKATDTAVVHVTGAEAVGGLKTFSTIPQVSSYVAPTANTELAAKKYVDDGLALKADASALATTNTNVAAKAADNAVVHLTGLETINGVKTFASLPTIPQTPSAATDAASKGYVDARETSILSTVSTKAANAVVVHNTGTESIDGVKTFTSLPTIPQTPSATTDAASKGYVDTQDGIRDTAIAAKAADSSVVHLAAAENITGVKTFATGATPLITDQPTTGTQAANKTYVDAQVASVSGSFGAPVADLTALQAIASATISDKQMRLVEATNSIWRYDQHTGAGLADTSGMVKPSDVLLASNGRWYKVQSATQDHEALTGLLGGAAADHQHLTSTQVGYLPAAGEKSALAGTTGTPGSANKFVTDTDTRMTNSRAPTSHGSSHGSAGGDAIPAGGLSIAQTSGLQAALDNKVGTGDARLSDSRAPTSHASTHVTGGSDVIANVVASGNSGLMSGTDKAKLDGVAAGATNLALSSTAPAAVGTAAAIGSGSTAAKADHVHAHGAQTDGTLHAAVTTSVNGFMAATDKTKLDGIAAGAQANETASQILTKLLTVDGSGSSLDADVLDGIDSTGFVRRFYESRTIPTTLTNYVELGTFAINAGAFAFQLMVVVSDSGFSVAKAYDIVVAYGTSAWATVAPVANTGAYGGNDFELELANNSGNFTIRIRRTAGSTPGTALATFAIFNKDGTTWTPTSATGVSTASGYFDNKLVATPSYSGFLSATDKSKLDGIAASATNTPLTSSAPATVGTSNSVGSATTAAKSDHVHAHGAQTDTTLHALASGSGHGFMSSTDFTKLSGVATGAQVNDTAAQILSKLLGVDGSSSSLDADLLDGNEGSYYLNASNLASGTIPAARFDDTSHGSRGGASLHALATGSAHGFLSSSDYTKLSGIATGATNTPLASVAGASVDATTAVVGVGTTAARADHTHAVNVGLVANITTIGTKAAGTSNLLARADHVHDHGNQGGGSQHSQVTTSVDGFMIAADKTKLDSVTVANIPSATQAQALAGTSGTPSTSNKYVTDADARNTNARTPTTHAATHGSGQSDAITIAETQVTNLVTDLAGKLGTGLAVLLTGDQSVDGIKTFTSSPHVPTPAASNDAANMGYVDSAVSSVSGSFAAPVQTVQNLRDVAPASRQDHQIRLVDDLGGLFRFDAAGVGTDDGVSTITPTTGTGRWFRITAVQTTPNHESLAGLLGGAANDHQHLTTTQLGYLPSASQQQALAGTSGTPGAANAYVTNADSRMTNSRTPTTHASTHQPGGADAIPTAAAITIGTANAEGSSTSHARADHVHDHGSQSVGTHHALATSSLHGFMSSTDKATFDAISTTYALKNNGTHTGTTVLNAITVPSVDALASGALALGGTNATVVNIGRTGIGVTLLGGSLTLTGGPTLSSTGIVAAQYSAPASSQAKLVGQVVDGGVAANINSYVALTSGKICQFTTGSGSSEKAYVNWNGEFYVGSNKLWHAGDFAISNYATLASPALTGSPTVNGSAILTAASTVNADTVDSKHASDFAQLAVQNVFAASVGIKTSGAPSYDFEVNGNIYASGDITSGSDIRLKENVETIPDALSKVGSLRGVSFNRKDMAGKPKRIGVIAQELQQVFPEAISEDKNGILSVNYDSLVGPLIEAVKELKKELESVRAELDALKKG